MAYIQDLEAQFYEGKPVERLLGRQCESAEISDDRLGKALDRCFIYQKRKKIKKSITNFNSSYIASLFPKTLEEIESNFLFVKNNVLTYKIHRSLLLLVNQSMRRYFIIYAA